MNASKSIIDSAIEARAKQEAEAEKERDKKLRDQADQMLEGLKEALGDFWILVTETGAQATAGYSRGEVSYLDLDLSNLSAFELAPISIHWTGRGYFNSYPFKAGGSQFSKIEEAIAAARKAFPDWKKRYLEQKLKPLYSKLRYYSREIETQEEALLIEKQILQIDGSPDNRLRAESAVKEWNRLRIQEAEQKEENARAQAEHERLEKEYIEALVNWMRETDRIEKENAIQAETMQRVSDLKTYTAYKITYGVVAFDEEGEKYLETRSVWTLDQYPASDGYYMVNGNPFKPAHLVSTEICEFKPSEGPISKRFSRAGHTIYFAPNVKNEKIRELREHIQELPEKPREPEGYYFGEAIREAREIYNKSLSSEVSE